MVKLPIDLVRIEMQKEYWHLSMKYNDTEGTQDDKIKAWRWQKLYDCIGGSAAKFSDQFIITLCRLLAWKHKQTKHVSKEGRKNTEMYPPKHIFKMSTPIKHKNKFFYSEHLLLFGVTFTETTMLSDFELSCSPSILKESVFSHRWLLWTDISSLSFFMSY